MKILIVEDNADLREIIVKSLQKEHYIVEEAPDYKKACEKMFVYEYDIILVDIMLPDGNGLDLLKEMNQRKHNAHVIILSAKDSIEDKVYGLELGADDYLAKPFHLAELHARIKSVLRRTQRNGNQLLEIGNVSIDPDKRIVMVDSNIIELGKKEYDILLYFMNRPNRLIEKEMLAEAVWGDNIDMSDNFDFVYAQIKNLRKRLKEASATIELKTIYGFGYKLVN